MYRRPATFDLLCETDCLMAAWKRVRSNRGAAGIDQVSLVEFERNLIANLEDMAERLREGRYYPMPLRAVEMQKRNGGTRKLGILTVEDRIVQRAALDALEPLFEPSFLDCSYGFRPGRSVEMAVGRVLEYRSAGDTYVVDADISDCFGSLDHSLLVKLVGDRVRDKRMITLVRMWLDTGQVLSEQGRAPLFDRAADFVSGSIGSVITRLLDEGGHSYTGYYSGGERSLGETDADLEAEAQKRARKEVLKRLGRDGALLALTYLARGRKLLSPGALALTGAAALAAATVPAASRALRERFGSSGVGAVQGGSLSPLLCNIYLHEFDKEMIRAGLHLVRYADDFVIVCRDESSAEKALALAGRVLDGLRLRLHPQKTRITRFDAGLEFLGYEFDRFTPQAKPVSQPGSTIVAALRQASSSAGPTLAKVKNEASGLMKSGARRVASIFKLQREGNK